MTWCVTKEMAAIPLRGLRDMFAKMLRFLGAFLKLKYIALTLECLVLSGILVAWMETYPPADPGWAQVIAWFVIAMFFIGTEAALYHCIYKPWRRQAEEICRDRYEAAKSRVKHDG